MSNYIKEIKCIVVYIPCRYCHNLPYKLHLEILDDDGNCLYKELVN